MSISLNAVGYHDSYNNIEKSIPTSIIITGDVALEENWLYSVEDEIELLNKLQILNRKFCEDFMRLAHGYFDTLTPREFMQADIYIKRSFFLSSDDYSSRYKYLLLYALNIAVTARVDHSNSDNVYEILKKQDDY